MEGELENQIHVLNNFQVFIPIAGDADLFVFTQTTSPSFGLTLTRIDTRESYHYQIQMLQLNGGSEDLITNGLVWAKRTPYQFQKKENTSITEALVCRLRVTTGVFDFRRIKHRSIRFVVRCFSNNVILSTGISQQCRILPKKRVADDEPDDNNNVIIPISWMLENAATESQENQHRESGLDLHPTEQFYSSPEEEQEDSVMENFNESAERFNYSNENEGDSDDLSLIPASEGGFALTEHELITINNQTDQYMVLYNGNAEVIGNFRALNFYKASDVRIKEDVRLLMDDYDCRDVLLKIDGVEYRFKEGATNAPANKRFVGYIAQQIESVVPEAVQLIDGILHVDYESLIPYLSESIKKNFKDIKDVKADTKQIHRIIDMMYAEFITKEKRKNDRKSTSAASKQQFRSRSLRWIIGTSLGLLLLVSLAVALVFLLPFMNGPNVDNPSNPSSPSTPRAPTSPSESLVPFTGLPSVDQDALVELYHATHGPGWRSLASPSTSVCEWGGVVCDGNGRVFDIDMEHSNMWGTIPDSIGTLKYLRSLRLASNALSGTIPASIGNLTNLNELIIADAQFNGTVPVEIFSLPFLEKLLIGDNPNLSWTIPPQIGNLKRLQSFSARNTRLHGTIPDEISHLKKLKFLVLDSNYLTGTVPSLKNAPLLIQLYLYDNQLIGTIPFVPGGYIGALDLSGNKFSGTVENLERARPFSSTPTEIGLAMNNLSGEFYLPKQIMENSDYIHINDNNFTSLSPKLANVTLLGGCRANNNPFRCPIPEWFRTGCQATCV